MTPPTRPAAGSDTDRLLHGVNTNNPGTTNISPDATGSSTQPGGTNTTTPVPTRAVQPGADNPGTGASTPSGPLTPEQVYQQLQQMHGGRNQPQTPSQTAPTPAPTGQPQ